MDCGPKPYGLRETPCTISTMDCGLAQPGRSHDLGQSHNPGSSRRHADSFPSCPSVSLPARATGGAPPADTQIGRSPAAAVEPPRSGSPALRHGPRPDGTPRLAPVDAPLVEPVAEPLSELPVEPLAERPHGAPSRPGPAREQFLAVFRFRSAAPRAGTRRWGDPDPARKRIARAHEPDPMPRR